MCLVINIYYDEKVHFNKQEKPRGHASLIVDVKLRCCDVAKIMGKERPSSQGN